MESTRIDIYSTSEESVIHIDGEFSLFYRDYLPNQFDIDNSKIYHHLDFLDKIDDIQFDIDFVFFPNCEICLN